MKSAPFLCGQGSHCNLIQEQPEQMMLSAIKQDYISVSDSRKTYIVSVSSVCLNDIIGNDSQEFGVSFRLHEEFLQRHHNKDEEERKDLNFYCAHS